jgi:hypothetical protein
MLEPISTTLSIGALKRPLESLYEGAIGRVKQKLRTARAEAGIRTIYKAINTVQKVKTLWRIDKEVKLASFYYPSAIIVEDGRPVFRSPSEVPDHLRGDSELIAEQNLPKRKYISNVSEIARTGNILIQGTVGQGKSTFLRYLCIQELGSRERIPIFLELRRFDGAKSFREFLAGGFGIYNLPGGDDVFEYLIQSGKILLLLDAFDELEQHCAETVVAELEILSQKYPQMQIAVTSRPDSGLEQSAHFRTYKLAPLAPQDHQPFLKKIDDDPIRIGEIMEAIWKRENGIASLLQTPLLMTLLVIVYSGTQSIPSSLAEFYGALFQTLLTRHDKTKPAFQRRRATYLSETDLQKLFEAFSYAARQESDSLVISDKLFIRIFNAASAETRVSCRPEAFSSDITKITCLILHEGFHYHFIHKSVAEFHAASFIANAPDEVAKRFYSRLCKAEAPWYKWREELAFLTQIDSFRYLRDFYVPGIGDLLESFGIVDTVGDVPIPPDSTSIRRFLNTFSITDLLRSATGKSPQGFFSYQLQLMIFHGLRVIVTGADKEIAGLGGMLVGDGLDALERFDDAAGHIWKSLETLRWEYYTAKQELSRKVSSDFVDP